MSKARDLANAGTALTTVSATELGYVDGVTSAIQTQLDAKTAKSTLTTTGDIYYASAANTPARLGIGSTDQVLKVTAGIPAWATPASSIPALNEQVFTSSGTFTPGTGVTKVWVEILGGGGSGGKQSDYTAGGGNAGARVNKQFTVTPGTGVTVTIGAGGATKTTNGDGNAGTGSTFDTETAGGGQGGRSSQAVNLTWAASMGDSSYAAGGVQGGAAAANSGAGGGGNDGNGGAGGSGRIIVRWLS